MTLFPGTTFSHRNRALVPCLVLAFLQSKSYNTNTNIERIDVILGEKASGESTFGRIDLIPHQLGVFMLSTSLSITLVEYLTCEIPQRPDSWRDSLHITPLSSVIILDCLCGLEMKISRQVLHKLVFLWNEITLTSLLKETGRFDTSSFQDELKQWNLHKNFFHLV